MTVRGILTVYAGTALLLAVLLLVSGSLDHRYPLPLEEDFSSVVTDVAGQPLRSFTNASEQWRYPITDNQLGDNYKALLIGYEDRWFYRHPGVNPLAMLRAGWQNVSAGRVISGGSTLTMQVARLLDPHERSLSGKLKQVLRAFQLEWHLSKTEILNLYINRAPFGGTLSGVQAASYSYFGKPANALSDAQAALLAVLPQAPSRWRPDRYPQAARQARDKVLRRMAELQLWPQARVEDALTEPVVSLNRKAVRLAPLLARRLRSECPECGQIQTLIRRDLQQGVEAVLRQQSRRFPEGVSAAVLVMDNRDGAVQVYAGSADFLNSDRFGHVDMVQAVRSPGSTLKPFLFGMALEDGLIHSQSLLSDAPRYRQAYRPANFSGGFNGPVSATEALQRSLNIPAVQLLEAFGAERFASRLRNGGLQLSGPGARQPNVAMILGGVGTTLESLVGSYSALARQGNAIRPRLQPETPQQTRYLLSPGAAWVTWKMLAGPLKRLQRSQQFHNRWPLAWKTGTSYGFREAWAIGVSQQRTIGVWVGRPDGSAAPGLSGRSSAAPLLFKIHRLLGGSKEAPLPMPDNVTQEAICWPAGSAADALLNQQNNNCMRQQQAWVIDGQVPRTLHSEALQQTVWLDRATGLRVEPACSDAAMQQQRYSLWPRPLEPWLLPQWRRAGRLPAASSACRYLTGEQQAIRITSLPDAAQLLSRSGQLRLDLQAQGGSGNRFWYDNGRYLGRSSAGGKLVYKDIPRGKHQLSVVDEQGNADRLSFVVR
ncbi:penicillin-binding protein 1C [Aliamphritea hakodatensis]|uniref:penicillin-binding protein 1C n=1 Tax=Aliamphritea hakodatensis TaxID=2895352 RepID=UPI0022FD8E2B|nr:penicillin-binding protein 1C [Aliamphritea hakodatensis]